jgi:cephalosporin-C deacetylase-like acetyl esterase
MYSFNKEKQLWTHCKCVKWSRFYRYGCPDWEKVVSTVIDFIPSTKKEVDPQRISLIGYSMGRYLAPRAAAFDDRIAACIADDGVLSIYDAWINQLQLIREDIENRNAAVVNAVIQTLMNLT